MNSSIFRKYRSLFSASVLTAVALLGFVDVVAKEPSIAERLQRMEDKEAIHSLLERYFEYQESRNFDAFANLFSKDGELVLRRGISKGGPAGIRAAMGGGSERDSTRTNTANTPSRNMKHILSNVHIELNGDTATAMSRWTMLVQAEDNRTRVGGTGRYGDKLVRENGQWKFQQRILYSDIPGNGESGPRPGRAQ
jgi:hypothetical protein